LNIVNVRSPSIYPSTCSIQRVVPPVVLVRLDFTLPPPTPVQLQSIPIVNRGCVTPRTRTAIGIAFLLSWLDLVALLYYLLLQDAPRSHGSVCKMRRGESVVGWDEPVGQWGSFVLASSSTHDNLALDGTSSLPPSNDRSRSDWCTPSPSCSQLSRGIGMLPLDRFFLTGMALRIRSLRRNG